MSEIANDWPEIQSAAENPDPPVVKFCCPRDHWLVSVTVGFDQDNHAHLVRVDSPRRTRIASADSSPSTGISADRVTLDCGSCKYHGRYTQSRLLKVYAVALRLGMESLKLL